MQRNISLKKNHKTKEIIIKCREHGDCDISSVIKSGKNKSGSQKYKCKMCHKKLRDQNYARNKEKIAQKTKAWREANPEKKQKLNYDWWFRNKDRLKVSDRARKASWEAKNHEKRTLNKRASKKRMVAELADSYVKQKIVVGTKLRHADIPDSLVQFTKP